MKITGLSILITVAASFLSFVHATYTLHPSCQGYKARWALQATRGAEFRIRRATALAERFSRRPNVSGRPDALNFSRLVGLLFGDGDNYSKIFNTFYNCVRKNRLNYRRRGTFGLTDYDQTDYPATWVACGVERYYKDGKINQWSNDRCIDENTSPRCIVDSMLLTRIRVVEECRAPPRGNELMTSSRPAGYLFTMDQIYRKSMVQICDWAFRRVEERKLIPALHILSWEKLEKLSRTNIGEAQVNRLAFLDFSVSMLFLETENDFVKHDGYDKTWEDCMRMRRENPQLTLTNPASYGFLLLGIELFGDGTYRYDVGDQQQLQGYDAYGNSHDDSNYPFAIQEDGSLVKASSTVNN